MASGRVRDEAGRAAAKGRHEEVLRLLEAHGLPRGPRRVARVEESREQERSRARRLRAALEALGPVFSSFGIYMATRVDLLPAEDRLELAAIENSLKNLMTFPCVRILVERGKLQLHGAYFGVATGVLLVRDPETGAFKPAVEEVPERISLFSARDARSL